MRAEGVGEFVANSRPCSAPGDAMVGDRRDVFEEESGAGGAVYKRFTVEV